MFIRIRIIYKEMDSSFSVHILFVQTRDTDYVPSGSLQNTSVKKRIDGKFQVELFN